MDLNQRNAIKLYRSKLIDEIHAKSLLPYLPCLPNADRDRIRHEVTEPDQNAMLLDILQNKDRSWEQLLQALQKQEQFNLATKLRQAAELDPATFLQNEQKITWRPDITPYFNGREDILNSLSECFSHKKIDMTAVVALFGLGGVGKTQIALQFISVYKKNYDELIAWLRADSKENLENDLLALAKLCNIAAEDVQTSFVKLKLCLEKKQNWLMVYDNVFDYSLVHLYMPRNAGHVLITSQISIFPEWIHHSCQIEISPFNLSQSLEYIKIRLGTEKFDAVSSKILAEELGHLPLALAQASAYIHETCLDIPLYLKLYAKDKKDTLLKVESVYHIPLHSTFNLAMEQVKSESKLAYDIIQVAALLHPDKIPCLLFETLYKKKLSSIKNEGTSTQLLDALRSLKKFSLVNIHRLNYENSFISLHRMVQTVIRNNWREDDRYWLDNAFDALKKRFSYDKQCVQANQMKQDLLPHAYMLFEHEKEFASKSKPKHKENELQWLHFQYRIAEMISQVSDNLGILQQTINMWEHIYEIIQITHSDMSIETDIPNRSLAIELRNVNKQNNYTPDTTTQYINPRKRKTLHNSSPMIVSNILINLAASYHANAETTKTHDLLERALAIQVQHYGPHHPEVASTLRNLSTVFFELGDATKQRELLEGALAIQEPHYGTNHPEVALTLVNLSTAYSELGDSAKQRELLERALAIQEPFYSPNHPEVSKTLVNLSTAYEALGNTAKQRELLERALAIQEPHYGPDHTKVALTLVNLSTAYSAQGNTAKQRELLERALAIQEPHYGPNHPEVSKTLVNLSTAYGALGNTAKQRELLERALAIQEPHYGPNHTRVALTLVNLSTAYGELGNPAKARELLERALAIQEPHYGPNHSEVALTLVNLSTAYSKLGNTAKQRELLERALSIQEAHYGPNHIEVALTLVNLSTAYGELGNSAKARELLERALSIQEPHYGPNHPTVALTLVNLSNAYSELGDTAKARELLEAALAIQEPHYGPNHPEVALTLVNLSTIYSKQGYTEKQINLLERALPIQETHYGPNHPKVALTLVNLSAAHGKLGNAAKQSYMLERVLAIRLSQYGPKHPKVALTLVILSNAYGKLGNTEKQLELLETALVIQEGHYGPSHPEVALTLAALASALVSGIAKRHS